jgi:hypothetical protein
MGRVTREEAIERLRVWTARAQHEALEADTWEDAQNWQGQTQVLGGVASFVAGQGPEVEDAVVWRRVVADRERALTEWLARQGSRDAAFFAGAIAGYDLALTALKDMAGRSWPKIEPHAG